MQPALQILDVRGPSLGINGAWHVLLDHRGAIVGARQRADLPGVLRNGQVAARRRRLAIDAARRHSDDLLVAISLGAVFMGANTYIGNGPNFMVKTIAEKSGVRMPSFFGYMAYSGCILIPLFVLVISCFLQVA